MLRLSKTIAALLLLIYSAGGLAHAKTDVITLHNGDRITGEIKSLTGGRLSYGTSAMGTLQVEWKEIARLRSNFNYEVRHSDGSRYFGLIGPGQRPGALYVKDSRGDFELDWHDVVELRPIETTARDRLDVYLSAGLSYNRASAVTQTSFNTQISYEDENTRNQLTGRTNITDNGGEQTRSNRYSVSRQKWTQRTAMYRWLSGGYEDNDELNLDARITVGAGLGHYVIDTNRSRLSGVIGLQGVTEQLVGDNSQQSLEGVLGTSYMLWRFDTPELDVSLDFNLYPGVTEAGRLRGDTDIRVRWEIIEDLYLDLTTWATYDNETGDDGNSIDWGITTGLGIEF